MNLYEATRELHHGAEQHPFSQSMLNGTITKQQWVDWMGALYTIHYHIDDHVPDCVKRAEQFIFDVSDTGLVPRKLHQVQEFISTLKDKKTILGAQYILIGAHKRGGRVIENAMKKNGLNFKQSHLLFEDNQGAELFIRQLREDITLVNGANLAFEYIIKIFDEIIGLPE